MPQRLDEFNKKFVYTKTSPEEIISAKKNSLFFRKGNEFWLNSHNGAIDKWKKLPYRTVILPVPSKNKLIKYEKPYELWLKTTDGFYDQQKNLLPKTGWVLVGYTDVFAKTVAYVRPLNWIFPPPASSTDPIGTDNSKSYDENFYYAKLSGVWYRTPITLFTFPSSPSPEVPSLTSGLPFVELPRTPVPNSSDDMPTGYTIGEQTYDIDFFYIKVSKWKRSALLTYYDPHKMAKF